MHAHQLGRWVLSAVVLAITVAEVRADVITPDSIPNPPGAVGSGVFTPVPPGDLVTTQYTRVGLYFPSAADGSTTALTTMNGVKVWTPAIQYTLPPFLGAANVSEISPGRWVGGSFVASGTMTPTTVSSVTLELIGARGKVDFFDTSSHLLGFGTPSGIGPHGGFLYTFAGSGIQAFSIPYFLGEPGQVQLPWGASGGVAEVSFTLAHAPEPSSLVLAGLGVLGLAFRFGWRRVRVAA
jgi:hypothetical protein